MLRTLLLLLAFVLTASAPSAQKGAHTADQGEAPLGGVANDDRRFAFPIYGGQNSYSGTNVGATDDATQNPSASCTFQGADNDGDNSVWWMFRPTTSGSITLDFDGSSFDTIVTLITERPFQEFACNDDDPNNGSGDFTSLITADVTAGEFYYVRVTGFQGTAPSPADGTIQLTVSGSATLGAPSDPSIAGGVFILDMAESGVYTETTIGATEQAGEPTPSCAPGAPSTNSIWRFIANPGVSNGLMTFDLAGSSFDTVLSIHDSFTFAELACNDDDGQPGNTSSLEFTPSPNDGNYLVRISGFDNAEGRVTMDYTFIANVSEEPGAAQDALALDLTGPNPAGDQLALTVSLLEAGAARLSVFDALGREVAGIADRTLPAGPTALSVPTADLPAGVYTARVTAGEQSRSVRFTVLH